MISNDVCLILFNLYNILDRAKDVRLASTLKPSPTRKARYSSCRSDHREGRVYIMQNNH